MCIYDYSTDGVVAKYKSMFLFLKLVLAHLIADFILQFEELYQLKVVPLQSYQSNVLFGVTTTTSQQAMTGLRARFQDVRVAFAIISDVGYREYMRLYDPPKQVIYQDIAINQFDRSQYGLNFFITTRRDHAQRHIAQL